MAKLSSEQRKNLPEDVFGLPEDRAYPMPDESHVRSAITYFHSCPPDKKKELAANINRIAKKYGMKLKLDKHSPFRPYADKEILEESTSVVVREGFYMDPDVMRKLKGVREVMLMGNNIQDSKIEQGFSDDVKSAINVAIRTAAKNYLDQEYLLNGGVPKGSFVKDFVYDSDLDLCYDITREFVYGRTMADPEMQKKVSMVHDKQMLKSAFNNVKKKVNAPIITKVVDDINKKIDQADNTSLLTNVDQKLHSGDTTLYIQVGDFTETIAPKFRNFSEEDIQRIEEYAEPIMELGDCAKEILITQCHYPPGYHIGDYMEAVLQGMDQKGIINGYYVCGDHSSGISKRDICYPYYFKMDKSTYLPVHLWQSQTEPLCVVTALKIFDDDNHPQFFHAILDEFYRTKKLPKMPIRRITMKGTLKEPEYLEEAVKFFNIKTPDKVLLDKLGHAANILMKDKNERVQKIGKMVSHLVEDLSKGAKNKGERIVKCVVGLVVALSVLTFVMLITLGVLVLIIGIIFGLMILLPGIALAAIIDPSTRKRIKFMEKKCPDKKKVQELKKLTSKL